LFGGEVNEASAAAENLDMIGNFSVVDRYFELALTRLRSINPKLARLTDYPIAGLRYAD
jgi:hypothetical protein